MTVVCHSFFWCGTNSYFSGKKRGDTCERFDTDFLDEAIEHVCTRGCLASNETTPNEPWISSAKPKDCRACFQPMLFGRHPVA